MPRQKATRSAQARKERGVAQRAAECRPELWEDDSLQAGSPERAGNAYISYRGSVVRVARGRVRPADDWTRLG